MLLDANGKRPSEYPEMYPDAHCPGCKRKLYKRGGGHKKCIEHWVHERRIDGLPDCEYGSCSEKESDWHLAVKLQFRDAGYAIEKSTILNGKMYRIDAVCGGCYVELINTMSNRYEQKAIDIRDEGRIAVWIFNGLAFSHFSGVGYSVTGSALRFVKRTAGLNQKCYVLFNESIYALSSSGRIYDQPENVTIDRLAASVVSSHPVGRQSEFPWSVCAK